MLGTSDVWMTLTNQQLNDVRLRVFLAFASVTCYSMHRGRLYWHLCPFIKGFVKEADTLAYPDEKAYQKKLDLYTDLPFLTGTRCGYTRYRFSLVPNAATPDSKSHWYQMRLHQVRCGNTRYCISLIPDAATPCIVHASLVPYAATPGIVLNWYQNDAATSCNSTQSEAKQEAVDF